MMLRTLKLYGDGLPPPKRDSRSAKWKSQRTRGPSNKRDKVWASSGGYVHLFAIYPQCSLAGCTYDRKKVRKRISMGRNMQSR